MDWRRYGDHWLRGSVYESIASFGLSCAVLSVYGVLYLFGGDPEHKLLVTVLGALGDPLSILTMMTPIVYMWVVVGKFRFEGMMTLLIKLILSALVFNSIGYMFTGVESVVLLLWIAKVFVFTPWFYSITIEYRKTEENKVVNLFVTSIQKFLMRLAPKAWRKVNVEVNYE